jgi:rod shape-determining protein MreC
MKKRNAPNRALYTAAAIILLLAAVLLINRFSSGFFARVAGSAQKNIASYFFYVGDTFKSIRYISSAKNGIKILSEKNMLLETENQVLRTENEKLARGSALRTFRDFHSSVICMASAIGANNDGLLMYITLDRGLNDGVSEGDGVITREGVAGRVVKSQADSCMVQLLTDVKSSISSRVERTRLVGILAGESYDMCTLNYVPKEEDVRVGDVIVTSGLGKSFPEGVKIGVVTEANKRVDGLSMMIKVKPFVDMLSVEEVFIVKKRQD